MNENFCRAIADAISSKKVVIYGAGFVGASMLNVMDKLGKEVIFFLDKNVEKQKSGFCGYEVKAPEEILYEDMSKTIVVVAVGVKKEIEDLLTSFGLRSGIEFIYGTSMRHTVCDAIDPLLGYCRSSDLNGFKTMGEGTLRKENKNIICLGGSTTDYTQFGIKSWPEYLVELFEHDNINVNVLNGGVIGYTSSQELLKLLRDGLELNPSLVISYSGVNDLGMTPTMECEYLRDVWQNMLLGYGFGARFLSDELSVSCEKKSRLDSAEYWYRNEKIMRNICQGFSIPFLGILQPSAHTRKNKYRSLNEQRAFNEVADSKYIYTVEQFEKAKKLVNADGDKNFIDLTAIFDVDKDVYVDICHVFEEGNQMIAKSIYQIIKERDILDI